MLRLEKVVQGEHVNERIDTQSTLRYLWHRKAFACVNGVLRYARVNDTSPKPKHALPVTADLHCAYSGVFGCLDWSGCV